MSPRGHASTNYRPASSRVTIVLYRAITVLYRARPGGRVEHVGLFRQLRSKSKEESAPATSRSCSHDAATTAALRGLTLEIDAIRVELVALRLAFTKLDDFRRALEAKTWTDFQRRRAGRVAAGVARAASARRDARGRYL